MDVVELTRNLGAAIQEDERYLAYVAAQKAIMEDAEMQKYNDRIEELRQKYSEESMKPSPDKLVLENLDQTFQRTYSEMMQSDIMTKFAETRNELDKMMNYLIQILSMSVNGEDPKTCEPNMAPEGGCPGCGGDCGSDCGPDCGCDGCC